MNNSTYHIIKVQRDRLEFHSETHRDTAIHFENLAALHKSEGNGPLAHAYKMAAMAHAASANAFTLAAFATEI